MAGHTLSLIAEANSAFSSSKPSISQSRLSFAARCSLERTGIGPPRYRAATIDGADRADDACSLPQPAARQFPAPVPRSERLIWKCIGDKEICRRGNAEPKGVFDL